ncbi:MAG: DUF389 domain-containing protein [Thermonemataceae bacterium]
MNKRQDDNLLSTIYKFVRDILALSDGIDKEELTSNIRKDIAFRGHSIWILICSIFIASLGLNTNSGAVIIGAMLISPLMGPILGTGLAIAINDLELLKRSLKNFGVMVVVSLITSVIYFSITPISAADSEILGRTKPTILDALIAVFGGVAGIIGNTRKEKSNVIPGVAIATALMPPLCTAGYGMAIGRWDFFLGAFYLFFMNAVLICIATYVIIRLLGYGRIEQVDAKQEKRVNWYISIFVALVLVPSGWLFIDVVKESWFKARASEFISDNFAKGTIINRNLEFDGKEALIELFVVGDIEEEKSIRKSLAKYNLSNTKLVIHELGSADIQEIITKENQTKQKVLQDLYQQSEYTVRLRDTEIDSLNRFIRTQRIINDPAKLQQELFALYENLTAFSLTNAIEVKKEGETLVIPVATVKWDGTLNYQQMLTQEEKMTNWIQVRYDLDTLKLVRY